MQEQWQGLNLLFSDIQRFSNGVDLWGGQLGQNDQKLHENYKIIILKQSRGGGGRIDKLIFWLVGWVSPSPSH